MTHKAEVSLEPKAKTIIELFETWEKTKWETLDEMYAFLHTKRIPLVDAQQQLSEEKKWAKHWAEEATKWKTHWENACSQIAELEGRLQHIRALLKTRPSHKWMIRNLDKIEDVESFFRKLEKEVEK